MENSCSNNLFKSLRRDAAPRTLITRYAQISEAMKKIIKILVFWASLLPLISYAGAWGTGSFENDSALDWVYDLERSKSASYLLNVFKAIPVGSYIDVDTCSAAIAAADVVASLKDGETIHLPESVKKWVVKNQASYRPTFSGMALEAIVFCKSSEYSELSQLWNEAAPEEWLSEVSKIEARLK